MAQSFLISAISISRKQVLLTSCRQLVQSGFSFFAAFCLALSLTAPSVLYAKAGHRKQLPQEPVVNSFIVKEIGSTAPLMAKDIDRAVSPASLTKILTCIIAIESGKLDHEVVITKEATMVEPSKAGFNVGDRIKLIDLVRAAMVSSSNDAAFAIAIYLSGNVDAFVTTMNNKARTLGMKNSRFTNPAGFDKGIYTGNTSTAADLMRLTEYAVKNPVFSQVARLEKVVVHEQTGRKVFSLRTHNKLLDKYPYAVGIKTGYTCKAGGCLIARAIKDNKDVLLVMLNARNRWDIASNMFDTAFAGGNLNPDTFIASSRTASPPSASSAVKAGLAANVVSSAKARHKSGKQVVARLKNGRKSSRLVAARHKVVHASKKQMIALKGAKKSGKHQLAMSKQSRKNRRRVNLS